MFNGAIYASLALALVTIYRSTGLVNLAQGEMATFSAYLALVFSTPTGSGLAGVGIVSVLPGHPWPIPIAIGGAIVAGMAIGAVIERLVFRGVERATGELAAVNLTIGLILVFSGLTSRLWGTGGRLFPSPFPSEFDDHIEILGARLRFTTIGAWLTLLGVLAVLSLLIRLTKVGLAFRAITSNRDGAALVGIPVGRTLMIGWAVASGLGALSACLVAGLVILEPVTMLKLLIYALAAATLGGLDSPKGAIVGGFLVAQAQTMVPGYLGVPTELAVVPAVAAMLLVVLVRPSGLFGTTRVARV